MVTEMKRKASGTANKKTSQKSPPQADSDALISAFNRGAYAEAEQLALRMTHDHADGVLGWKVLGAARKQMGKHAEALPPMQQAVRLHPEDADNQFNLGVTLQDLGRSAEALECYRQAIAHRPGFVEAHSNLGNALKELGRFAEAESAYRQAIAVKPDYAKAHYNLGITLQALDRTDEAEAAYRQAIALKPDYALAHGNLGNVLRDAGRSAEAEDSYRRAIALKPDHFRTHTNLGVVLYETGRLSEAEACYRKAIALKPDFSLAHLNLGKALKALGRPDEEEACYRQTITLQPDCADAHNNLGAIMLARGQLAEAETSFRLACVFAPDLVEARNNLANVLREMGRSEEAEACYRQAIALDPDLAEAHSNLGVTLQDRGCPAEAEAAYRQAIALKPDRAEAYGYLASALKELDRLDEAEAAYHQAIAIDPDNASSLEGLANIQVDRGNFDNARQILDKALASNPDNPLLWGRLAALQKMTDDDAPWLEKALNIFANPKNTPRQKVSLAYALGKYYDDTRQYQDAFSYYKQANDTKKQIFRKYDPGFTTELTDQLIQTYQKSLIEQRHAGASDSMRPLFIVGMPRSGTSLLEQIVASHPATFGAGELRFWGDAARQHSQAALYGEYTEEIISTLAGACLANLDRHNTDALRVVDKMPGNFNKVGLIHAVFPNARILHTQRNPIDTCLSIYFQNFKSGHTYASDLDELAHYYRAYHRLMAHWRSVMPADLFLDVPYEAVVEDQPAWSRKVIEFIGLEWDEQCRDFHKTERRVGTASNWQVRQPVYKTSKERWRNYEQFVAPLMPLLDLASQGQ